MDGLSIGRVVHFTDASGETHAAMVTKVWDQETGYVNLHVLVQNPERPIKLETSRLFSEAREPNTWRWPPRD